MYFRTVAFSACVLVISACAVTDDPSKGGFVSGVSALSSGAYDKRIEERESKLSAIQERNQALATENAELRQESALTQEQYEQRKARASSLRSRISQLNSNIATQEKKLATQSSEQKELRARIAGMKTEIQQLESDLEGRRITLADYERRYAVISQEVEDAQVVYDSLY